MSRSKSSGGTKSAATRRLTRAARGSRASRSSTDPTAIAALPDDALLEVVQRQTFRYFWEGAHPVSGPNGRLVLTISLPARPPSESTPIFAETSLPGPPVLCLPDSTIGMTKVWSADPPQEG